ncbi:MAG: hypothetical protein WBW33_06750 [Bryobacteraceae bacterium]
MKVGLCLLFFAMAGYSQVQDPATQQQTDVGPTILSRTDMQVPAQVAREGGGNSFDYFFSVDGFYSTGVPLYNRTSNGGYGDSPGFDAGGGLDLHHNFRKGSVSLEYSGTWREYANGSYYNGYQQGLNFVLKYALTRRLQLSARQTIASAPNGTGLYQFSQSGVASTTGLAGESRVYVTAGTLTYQQSARLSYDIVGDFYASQYRPVSTYDSLGGGATGSINYRTSKKATVSFAYSFSHFSYSQTSADNSNNQSVYATYAYEVSPRTQFAVSGGATSASVTQMLEIGGSPPSFETIHSTTTFPYFMAQFEHRAGRVSASIQAYQRAMAGNGYIGVSKALGFSGSAGYTPSPKWAVSGTAGYQYLTVLGATTTSGNNAGTFASIGLSYKLSRHFGLHSGVQFYSYDYYGSVGRQPTTTLTFGLTFNSGDRPIIFF